MANVEDDVTESLLGNKDNEKQINERKEIEVEDYIQKLMRKGFITKVFGIVFFQLLLTTLMVILGFYSEIYRKILLNKFITIAVIIIQFLIIFACFVFAQSVPLNYILLIIFTLLSSHLIALATVDLTFKSVLLTLSLALVLVLSLIIYAMITKKDYTPLGAILSVSLTLLIVFLIIFFFIRTFTLLQIILNFIGLILFSIYLIYDVQLLLGNKRYSLSEDDYIFAALNIYLDIINIFLYLLSFFGKSK